MSRAVPPLLLIASAAAVTCAPSERTPSVDGIVKVMECPTRSECPANEECGTGDECAAVGGAASNLGFVVVEDHVLTYVGGETATVADADVLFRVTVPATGAGYRAERVSVDAKTGLALLKVLGKMKPVYEFARQRVETARTVHAFKEIADGHLPLVRGVVAAIEEQLAENRGDDAIVHIVHNALVGEAGYGSPLFNNCGEVVGVVVPPPSVEIEQRPIRALPGQVAVSTAPVRWLESILTSDDQEKNQQRGRELTFRRAPGRCASERTQLIQAVSFNIFLWVLVLAAVGVGLLSARHFRGGEDKSGGGSTQTGGSVEATQSEAEQAGASPPAGTGGAAK